MNALATRQSRPFRLALEVLALIFVVVTLPSSSALGAPMFEAPFLPFDIGAATSGLVAGDWDHDGILDVAATTGWIQGIAVLRGRGDGTFGMRQNYPTGPSPGQVVASDLDGNGEVDLVVVDRSPSYDPIPGRISILSGQSDGSFAPAYHIGVGLSFKSVAVADLDGDGHRDIVAANGTSGSVSVFMGSPGGFDARADINAGANPGWVTLADCDGDLVIDALVANSDYYNGAITFLHGNGDGSFSLDGSFAVGSWPSSIDLADLNGDGHLDVAVTNSGIASVSLSVLLGNGAGGFGARVDYPMPGAPRMVTARDIDLDGHLDVLVVCGDAALSILPGTGDGTFGSRRDLPVGPGPIAIAAGDANGDGFLDALVGSHNPGSVGVLLGRGDGTFGLGQHVVTPGEGRAVRCADLDEDGHLDLFVINQLDPHGGYGNTFSVYRGLGNGSFGPGVHYPAGFGPSDLQTADFNGDAHVDVVVASPLGSPAVMVRLGDGSGSLGPASTYEAGPGPSAIAVGDLNGDSHADLAVTQLWAESPSVAVLFGVGDGSFLRGPDLEAASPAAHVAIGDGTGNGVPDVVAAASYASAVSLFPGTGTGTFLEREDYPVGLSPGGPDYVLVRDLNNDGRPDIATATSYPGLTTVTVLSGEVGGFGPKTEYDVASGATSLVAYDFDSDGFVELVSANFNSNSITVLRGTEIGVFADRRDYGVGRSPNALATGDFDGDGRTDLAVRGGGVWVLRNMSPGIPTAISAALQDVQVEVWGVRLRWIVPDARSSVFSVQRRTAEIDWTEVGLAEFESGGMVRYEDRSVVPGERYAYRLFVQSASDQDYSSEVWILVPVESTPLALRLDPIYPNPFQSRARLNFAVPRAGRVRLAIYSVTGRLVATVADQDLPAGWRLLTWNGRDASGRAVASGTYFARLESAGEVQVRRLVVAR